MSKFETSTETGRKEYIMEELRLSVDLSRSYEVDSDVKDFLRDSGLFLEGNQLSEPLEKIRVVCVEYIQRCIGHHFSTPEYIVTLMTEVMTDVNVSNQNDYLIKHASYIIKSKALLPVVFHFLNVIEFVINQRRLRLL